MKKGGVQLRKQVKEVLTELEQNGRFRQQQKFCQHGRTTVYEHSVQVACMSLALAERFHIKVNRRSLIRGALLHDYFLYDWHKPERWHRLHGFRHPEIAWENAKSDFRLNHIEENIIRRHMFPVTPIPPMCTEAWVVCLADKYCAVRETVMLKR